MFAVFTSWGFLAIAVPVSIGIGVGVLSMNPPAYTLSRVAFTFAALLLIIRAGYWLAFEQSKRGLQPYVFGFVIFGIICVLWLWAMKSISAREHNEKVIVSPSEITLRHQTNKSFILRIRNNQDFSIFDVHLGISANIKTFPMLSIKIESLSKEEVPAVPFAMPRMNFSDGCSGIIIGSIGPHATREFAVRAEAERMKTDSKISFMVYEWLLESSLFDLATTPREKFPSNFSEFFGDNSSRELEKTSRVYAQRFKKPINSYFPDGKAEK